MKTKEIIASNLVEDKIILIRGQKVLIDRDMAELLELKQKI